MKAAVVGSIWAALEIILGSFLHNLRVPFSGTMLAIMSVYLIIAFVQIWDDRGLIWRAGLICALMKSVSPSAIILGPMTGIMLEALLLEVFIRLLGRNLVGYIAGGAVAVMSSLIHKAATLLILYGFDLVKILGDIYRFSVRQVNLEGADPLIVILIVACIYMVAGMAAAAGGYLAGKAYLKRKKGPLTTGNIDLKATNTLFQHSSPKKYSLVALLANLLMIILSLSLLNLAPLIPAISAGATYILFVFLYYKRTLNRLRKPGIWIQFIIIALVSAFLWNSASERGVFDLTGLTAGLKMIWRALIIITGFSAISVEMKNPLIRSVLYNRGLANLYQSLTLAFSALPSVISELPSPTQLLKSRSKAFGRLFRTAESLLPVLETENSRRPDIFILTGERQSGKTTFLKELIRIIRSKGVNPGGFISEGVHEGENRTGFNLADITTGSAIELCCTVERPGMIRQGRFWFSREALLKGEEIISKAVASKALIIVIDEVGPLEISGKGWYDAIESATATSDAVHIWTVRKSLITKAARRWNTGNVTVVDTTEATPEETAALIIDATREI
jgi:nucleoside-triphosphatase THEP1